MNNLVLLGGFLLLFGGPQRDVDFFLPIDSSPQERQTLENNPERMYPPPIHSGGVEELQDATMSRMEDGSRRIELESQKRMELRKFKLENASLLKQKPPAIGGNQLDPIVRHVQQRKVRLNALIQSSLEGYLTDNSSQIIWDFLEGARWGFLFRLFFIMYDVHVNNVVYCGHIGSFRRRGFLGSSTCCLRIMILRTWRSFLHGGSVDCRRFFHHSNSLKSCVMQQGRRRLYCLLDRETLLHSP